ncbi:MAG: translation initiation factor IF-1 [Patescibacteria group bacterium]|nr:translation initiation factor IF-1 [Patescibacteria group bacterium]MCL5224399.1 translation initiation factor IF-1 [Patescibacteria group bacterium]
MPRDNMPPSFMTANGMVVETLPGALFRLKMDDGRETLAYVSGKMRMHRISVLPGDRVTVEFSANDTNRGRITRRL